MISSVKIRNVEVIWEVEWTRYLNVPVKNFVKILVIHIDSEHHIKIFVCETEFKKGHHNLRHKAVDNGTDGE